MKTTDKAIRAYLLQDPENLRARVCRNGHVHVYTTRQRGDGGPRPWWMLAGLREDIARDMLPR